MRLDRTPGWWAIKEEVIFDNEEAMRELYHVIGLRLREISKKLGGRPRDPLKERCPCEAMTLARAKTLGHKCEAGKP